MVSKPFDGRDHSLIKVKHLDGARAVVDDTERSEVGDTDAYRVTVTYEHQPPAVRPLGDQLRLKDHVGRLHVDLIELTEWPWSVLDDVRDRVYSSPQVDLFGQWSLLFTARRC